jgi:hypothetical protein
MTTRDRINDIADMYDVPIVILEPEALDEAIIGTCEQTGRVVYDRMLIIEVFMRDGMNREEAEEYFEFNTLGTIVEGYPIFVDRRCTE